MSRQRGEAGLRVPAAVILLLLLSLTASAAFHPVEAYTPQPGDSFNYSETIVVNDGGGSYSGYTDQTTVSGMEKVDSLTSGNVSMSYKYSFQFSSNQGSSTSSASSGEYTWSTSSYTYVNGTDNQQGYSSPIYVWFAMNPSVPVGGTFYSLNTEMTVASEDYSLQLPTMGDQVVQTIEAQGTGQYQRNDSYGVFTATYTWTEYFDPTTGYIIGYDYAERDVGQYQGQAASFTYTDNLYVTSTSYALTTTSSPASSTGSFVSPPPLSTPGYEAFLPYIALLVIVVIVGVAAYVLTRRSRKRQALPEHSRIPPATPPPPPPSPGTPWQSGVDMGSRPPEQVVVKEVAMKTCKYCSSLIPTTAQTCPVCGAPQG